MNIGLKLFNSSTFTTWLNLISKSFSLLLIHPLIIKYYSVDQTNLWFILISAFSFLQIFDFGLVSNSTRIIAANKENKNFNLNQSIFDTFQLYIFISFLVFVIFFPILVLYLYYNYDFLSFNIIIYVSFFTCIAGIFNLFNNYFVSMFQGLSKVAVVQRTMALINVIIVFITLLIIFFLNNLFLTLFIFLSQGIVSCIVLYFLSNKIFDINIFDKRVTKLKFQSEVFSSSWKSGLGVIFSLGLFNSSGFIFNSLVGGELASKFIYNLQLVRAISTFSQAPFYSKIPDFNKLYYQNKIIEFKNKIKNSLFFSLLTYTLLFVSISVFFPVFLRIIESENSFVIDKFWIYIGIAFLFERITAMLLNVYSISKIIIWHFVNGLSLTLILFLWFFIFETHNPLSFAYSLIISYLFIVPFVIYLINIKFKLNLVKLLFSIILSFISISIFIHKIYVL